MCKSKIKLIRNLEYVLLFFCLSLLFFFIIPQSDIFLFRQNSSPTFGSMIDFSLYYGNGRFLGNFFGVFFSHYFEFAWIMCAVCMFLTILCANKVFLKNSAYTVFLTAMVVVFVSSGMFSECYTWFASFANYFIPITATMISLRLYCVLKDKTKGVLIKTNLSLALLVFSASACLYSENTTIVLVVLAILLNIEALLKNKKITLAGTMYFTGTLIGAATMFLIPVLTETSYKMDHYRGIATNIASLIDVVPGSLVRFAEIFNSFTLMLFFLSFAFIVYIAKQEINSKSKSLYTTFFLMYPLVAVMFRLFGYQSQMYPMMHIVEVLLPICYFVVWLAVIFLVVPKDKRITAIGWSVLLLSSIGPMLLVTQYGHRTYLTTYFIMLGMATYLLRESGIQETASDFFEKYLNKKVLTFSVIAIFTCTCLYSSMQLVGNYYFYLERTEYIYYALEEGREEAKVPVLPFISVSIEDEWPNIIQDIVLDKDIKIVVTDIDSCENAEGYKGVFSKSFITVFNRSFTHRVQSMFNR